MAAANTYPSDFEVIGIPFPTPKMPQVEAITSETLPMLAACASILADTHRNEDMRCLARLISRLCAHITYRETIHQEYKKAVFASYVPQSTSRS